MLTMLRPRRWASEGDKGHLAPWILRILAKKIVFLVSSEKKQILPLLDPPRKILEKPLVRPLKNPSDAHVHVGLLGLYFSTFIAY